MALEFTAVMILDAGRRSVLEGREILELFWAYRGSDCMRNPRRRRMDRRGILATAHRGVTHVRGKDCVHPDIGLVTSG